jgi:hypothetical protein
MLRDVVIHLHNEQPILADLIEEPTAGDSCLICTNLRTTNGTTPVFVERGDSTFVFPLAHVRFVEIRRASVEESEVAAPPEVIAEQPRAGRNDKGGKNARRTAPRRMGRPPRCLRCSDWCGSAATRALVQTSRLRRSPSRTTATSCGAFARSESRSRVPHFQSTGCPATAG